MALNKSQRIRIILDLLRDGVVANEPAYANVDMADQSITAKYVDAVAAERGKSLLPESEKRDLFLRRVRELLRDILHAKRVPQAERTARESESSAISAECSSEIGND